MREFDLSEVSQGFESVEMLMSWQDISSENSRMDAHVMGTIQETEKLKGPQMNIFYEFKCVSISVSDYLLTYKRLFSILDLPKSELLSNFPLLDLSKSKLLMHQARLARSSWLKSQAEKLSDRQERVLRLCG